MDETWHLYQMGVISHLICLQRIAGMRIRIMPCCAQRASRSKNARGVLEKYSIQKGMEKKIMMYETFTYNNYQIRKWKNIRGYSVDTLIAERKTGFKRPIICFWGHRKKGRSIGKECFSQWYKADFRVNHLQYCCMEQYMMAEKARIFGDEEIAKQIMNETMQDRIKGLGRKVKNFDEDIWNEVKYHIVLTGNYYKFSQNKQLREVLLSTGESILVEASPFDTIWGIGMAASNENAYCPEKWNGSNLLGFALTEVREEINCIKENENLNFQ